MFQLRQYLFYSRQHFDWWLYILTLDWAQVYQLDLDSRTTLSYRYDASSLQTHHKDNWFKINIRTSLISVDDYINMKQLKESKIIGYKKYIIIIHMNYLTMWRLLMASCPEFHTRKARWRAAVKSRGDEPLISIKVIRGCNFRGHFTSMTSEIIFEHFIVPILRPPNIKF